ncbi:hypothetical protein LAG90_15615 [Marinilongibacter aquaticus]|uniref:hypothetical protein n=1 Tax=Marinilongibacter aquaticus TaxID=2975157 RepID=UPI0021BDB4EE|nr:hypothetical protein [Marinilongibacter aquaticus]UBM58231.1 hypothetical protein LAG90_15615 [Marinilongibacter aquaticus]
MEPIKIFRGKSLSILLVFGDDYPIDRLQDVVVSLNNTIIGSLVEETVLVTDDARAFRVELTSDRTYSLARRYNLQVNIIDSELGNYFFTPELIEFVPSSGQHNAAVNSGSDITLNLNFTEGVIEAKEALYFRGFSAYEIAKRNGFSGTEDEFASFYLGSISKNFAGVNLIDNDAFVHNMNSSKIDVQFFDIHGRKVNTIDWEPEGTTAIRVYTQEPFAGDVFVTKRNADTFEVENLADGDLFEHGLNSEKIIWEVFDQNGRRENSVQLRPNGPNHVVVDLPLLDGIFNQKFSGEFYIKTRQ